MSTGSEARNWVEKLANITPSYDPTIDFRFYPCAVTLTDGTTIPRAYITKAAQYSVVVGPLDADPSVIVASRVSDISESALRLRSPIANEIYAMGESGMGYHLFVLQFDDGVEALCLTGDAVDFVDLPPDRLEHVSGVRPVGAGEFGREPDVVGSSYIWVVYE